MPKMTSTLDEMEAIIWQRFHNGEDIETVTNIMVFDYTEFSKNVVENIVKQVYLKDFKTD